MTLRYGEMQFMEAIGKVPRKSLPSSLLEPRFTWVRYSVTIDITPNEPGYEQHNPIDVDNGPAYDKDRTRTYDARDSSVTSQSSQESNNATRIADIQVSPLLKIDIVGQLLTQSVACSVISRDSKPARTSSEEKRDRTPKLTRKSKI
jgi:hypothetical protein